MCGEVWGSRSGKQPISKSRLIPTHISVRRCRAAPLLPPNEPRRWCRRSLWPFEGTHSGRAARRGARRAKSSFCWREPRSQEAAPHEAPAHRTTKEHGHRATRRNQRRETVTLLASQHGRRAGATLRAAAGGQATAADDNDDAGEYVVEIESGGDDVVGGSAAKEKKTSRATGVTPPRPRRLVVDILRATPTR